MKFYFAYYDGCCLEKEGPFDTFEARDLEAKTYYKQANIHNLQMFFIDVYDDLTIEMGEFLNIDLE